MKTSLSVLILFCCGICFSCSERTIADSFVNISPTPQIIEAKSKVINGNSDLAKITEKTFKADEGLRKVHFFDQNHSWMLGKADSFYRTENGGESWTKISLLVEKEAYIDEFFFLNQSVGWLNIQRSGDVNKNDTKSWLMKTTDGGKTWQSLLIQDFSSIDSIFFLDEKNGWIMGRTSEPENVYSSKDFFRKTNDGGITWTEFGENLYKKNGFEDARGVITGFVIENSENIKVSMRSNRLFETKNGGKTWNQFGPNFDFPDQTTLSNFGKLGNTNRLRMARGTWSIEGIYSYIATEKDNAWTVRWTDEALCIYDIIFISENELVAVGRLGVNLYKENHQEDGVVLYSNDGGENLQIIYQKKKISEINSITKIAERKFLAVGNNGLMIKI